MLMLISFSSYGGVFFLGGGGKNWQFEVKCVCCTRLNKAVSGSDCLTLSRAHSLAFTTAQDKCIFHLLISHCVYSHKWREIYMRFRALRCIGFGCIRGFYLGVVCSFGLDFLPDPE